MSENSTVAMHVLAAQRVDAAGQHLVGDARVHQARHGRAHALLAGDVFQHQHRAEPLLFGREQGQGGEVDGELVLADDQFGFHRQFVVWVSPTRLSFSCTQALLPAKNSAAGLCRIWAGLDAQDAQAGGIAGGDLFGFVEGDDGVRHRLQHRLVVVLHVLHVGEQLGVFQRDGNLRGEGAQARFILAGKWPAALVQHLRHADHLAVLVDDGHAQDGAGEVAGLLVEGRD
jgi:hypothetical protein